MRTRILFGSLRWTLAYLAVLGIAVAVRIATFDPSFSADGSLDAAVVLGAAAYGGVPSPVFAGRLEYAAELLRRGAVRFVIVTGGGRADPSNPEALPGVRFLLQRGADPARVLYERRSFNTPENLCFASQVGAARGLSSYAIVSDPLHVYRAMRYARDMGLDAWPAATPTTRYRSLWPKLHFLVRETYLYGKRLLTGRVVCR